MLPPVLLASQSLRPGETGRPAAHDHDAIWSGAGSARPMDRCVLSLRAHEDPAVAPFDGPACERAQGGGAQGLSGPQVEAGVMPGTPKRVADHETLGKRSVVVGAMRVEREDLRSAPHQEDLLASDAADPHSALGEPGLRNPLRQIRGVGKRFILGHSLLPSDRIHPGHSGSPAPTVFQSFCGGVHGSRRDSSSFPPRERRLRRAGERAETDA
jgi:hypothetical protein